MASPDKPDEAGKSRPGDTPDTASREADLARRSRELEAAIAARRPAGHGEDQASTGSRDMAGFGQAMKLSSEFIAGIAVGVGIGWLIDRLAGTSPWGLIIFLLLGFAAGVLNVLRSVGIVAEPDARTVRRKEDE